MGHPTGASGFSGPGLAADRAPGEASPAEQPSRRFLRPNQQNTASHSGDDGGSHCQKKAASRPVTWPGIGTPDEFTLNPCSSPCFAGPTRPSATRGRWRPKALRNRTFSNVLPVNPKQIAKAVLKVAPGTTCFPPEPGATGKTSPVVGRRNARRMNPLDPPKGTLRIRRPEGGPHESGEEKDQPTATNS
jgi:hypothetical protein